MRSRVKLVEKIADSIGIVLARSGADKRIVLDTFDYELQYFDVPEARKAQMEEGKSYQHLNNGKDGSIVI